MSKISEGDVILDSLRRYKWFKDENKVLSLEEKIVGYKNATKELGDIDAIFTRIDSVKCNDKISEAQKRVLVRNLLILALGYSKDTILFIYR